MSGRLREDRFVSAKAAKLPSAHAKRLAWALKNHGQALGAAVRRDTSAEARQMENLPEEQIPERVGRIILERADPTLAKTMTGWLVKQYAQGGLRLEDTGTANETLEMFQRYAPRLSEGQRDLGQYQSLAEAWDAVFHLAEAEKDKLSGKAQKAMDKVKAYAESRILRQDEDGFTIAVPLTEFAAKWWGKGTRWCTAADKDNQFWYYHEEAPLIVVVIPELKEKGKFLIWVTEDDVQFMNAADSPVSEVLIAEYWPRFEPVISFVLRLNGKALYNVPETLRTEELCKIALARSGWTLWHVPVPLRTDEVCRIAVTQNGSALWAVPKDLRTEDLCRIAVAQSGLALEHVPKDLRSEELCEIAVTKNGEALMYVPEKLRAEELCKIAVAQNGRALVFVPEVLRTGEFYRITIGKNSWALQYVPRELCTAGLCRIAVEQNGQLLEHVPPELRTKELCRTAVELNGWALRHVPWDLRTADLCRIAVAKYGFMLQHVPWDLCTEEMCRIAVEAHSWALQYVPKGLRTEDLCRIALAQDGWALKYVPQKLRIEDLCRIAVAQNGRALEHVPEALQSAVQQFVKQPQPTWDLAILDQWAEAMIPNLALPLVRIRHA
jgi:hypothetical protein